VPVRGETGEIEGEIEADHERAVLVGDPVEKLEKPREREKLDHDAGLVAPDQIGLRVFLLLRPRAAAIGPLLDVLAKDCQAALRQVVRIEEHLALDSPVRRSTDDGAPEEERLSLPRPALTLKAGLGGGRRGDAISIERDEARQRGGGFGSLLIAIAMAWAVGPVRLLAGLIAVSLMWGIVTVAVLAIWAGLWLHGVVP
jgi:hypothetical protein